MPTRVIAHPQPGKSGTLDVYIQGWADPFTVEGPTGLNTTLAELDIPRPDLFGLPPCGTHGCGLAAVATVLWTADRIHMVQPACTSHITDCEGYAARTSAPTLTIGAALRLPGGPAYRADSGAQMDALTTALAGHKIPPAVFWQPACRGCKGRLHTAGPGPLTWVTATGSPNCRRETARHIPNGGPVAEAIHHHYRALWGAPELPATTTAALAVA